MSTLYPNKYNNPTRTVVGTVNTTSDDMVLLCNTTSAAVIINLLDIPQNKWNAVWKLYVIDSSNNAVTNSITINAPSGFTINGSTSVVINVNGGICVVSISSNTSYLGTLNYSTSGGGAVEASDTAGTVVANCNNFKFDSTNFNVTNPSGNIAEITMADSGWLTLNGFEFMPLANRPEYRVIGKMVAFRGVAVVPLASNIAGSTLIPMTTSTPGGYYVNDAVAYTYTGSSPNGCLVNTDGSVTFNLNNSVFQSAITLDGTYGKGFTIATRVVKTFDVDTGVSLSTVFNIAITSTGRLIFGTYKDAEVSPFIPDGLNNGEGLGTLRPIIANVKSGQFAPDYRLMIDTPTPSYTNSAKTNASLNADYSISTLTNTFLFDIDSSNPNLIGGFQVRLDGLVGYIG